MRAKAYFGKAIAANGDSREYVEVSEDWGVVEGFWLVFYAVFESDCGVWVVKFDSTYVLACTTMLTIEVQPYRQLKYMPTVEVRVC